VTVQAARLVLQIPKVFPMVGLLQRKKTRMPAPISLQTQRHRGSMILGYYFLTTSSLHKLPVCHVEPWASFHPQGGSPLSTQTLPHPERPLTYLAPQPPPTHSHPLPRSPSDRVRLAICRPPQFKVAKGAHQAKHGVCTVQEVLVQWERT